MYGGEAGEGQQYEEVLEVGTMREEERKRRT